MTLANNHKGDQNLIRPIKWLSLPTKLSVRAVVTQVNNQWRDVDSYSTGRETLERPSRRRREERESKRKRKWERKRERPTAAEIFHSLRISFSLTVCVSVTYTHSLALLLILHISIYLFLSLFLFFFIFYIAYYYSSSSSPCPPILLFYSSFSFFFQIFLLFYPFLSSPDLPPHPTHPETSKAVGFRATTMLTNKRKPGVVDRSLLWAQCIHKENTVKFAEIKGVYCQLYHIRIWCNNHYKF